jgi:hypothetical protein
MKVPMRVLLSCLFAALLVASPFLSGSSPAQDKKAKSAEVKSQKSRGEGKDENIKSKSVSNDPKAKMEAPPSKGGEKSRGSAYANITVDNYTPYKVQIYANGSYIGLVSGYGTAVTYSTPGQATLYGKADFDDGSSLSWGPSTYNFAGGDNFTWNLK